MRRREILLAAVALLAAPILRAQQAATKVYRVGFLGVASASGYVRELDWIRDGLRKLGYVEGRNLTIEYRWAEGSPERLRQFAAEFVALKVDAILTHATSGALAASRETSTLPIVMADGGDPVAAGLAKELSRPGGNVTGSFSFVVEEVGKRLQLLKEVLPSIRRAAFLVSGTDPIVAPKRKSLLTAAATMRVEIQEFSVGEAADLPGVFHAIEKARCEAAVINNEPPLNAQASVIAGLAAVKRLPSVGYASYADAGGLIAYGANRPSVYGRAGHFLDRIFKGEKPGEIPFERAARFDTILNLKTARTLGLAIPQAVMLRADRVIE